MMRSRRAATAAPEPELEPQGLRSGAYGLRTCPPALLQPEVAVLDEPDSGVDLPDLVVMAMSNHRKAPILTWDFRHFRAVVLRRGHHWPLVVTEHELPPP